MRRAGRLARGPSSLASCATRTGTNVGALCCAPLSSRRQRYSRLAQTSAPRAISERTKARVARRPTTFDLRRASLDDPNCPLAWIRGAKMRQSRGLKQSSILVPVLSRPAPQHIMWISNSLAKCGSLGPGTMCSMMRLAPCLTRPCVYWTIFGRNPDRSSHGGSSGDSRRPPVEPV